MGCSVISLCVIVGATLGSLVPLLWGDSGLGFTSLFAGAIGGLAGLWAGVRLSGALSANG